MTNLFNVHIHGQLVQVAVGLLFEIKATCALACIGSCDLLTAILYQAWPLIL